MRHPHLSHGPSAQQLFYIIASIAIVLTGLVCATSYLLDSRESRQYQAVFLDNGQVYFGKLSGKNQTYLTLRDVYYFQVDPVTNQASDPGNPDLSLVRLGSELHGPENKMEILRDRVLLIEELRDNSRVIRAILDAQ